MKGRKPKVKLTGSVIRRKNVIEYSMNPDKWKKRIGYGYRWVAETVFSCIKTRFGEHVNFKKFENIITELSFKAVIHNILMRTRIT